MPCRNSGNDACSQQFNFTYPEWTPERFLVKAMEFGKNLKECVTALHFTQRCILFKITMDGLPQNFGLQKKKNNVLALVKSIPCLTKTVSLILQSAPMKKTFLALAQHWEPSQYEKQTLRTIIFGHQTAEKSY